MREIFFISECMPRFGGYKKRVDTAMELLKKFGRIRYYYFKDVKDAIKIRGAIKLPETNIAEKVYNILTGWGSLRLHVAPSIDAISFMKDEIRKRKPSLIYAHNMSGIMLASELTTDIPIVYDFTDAISVKFEQLGKVHPSFVTATLSKLESFLIRTIEFSLKEADLALFISSRDKEQSHYRGRAIILPNKPEIPKKVRVRKEFDFVTIGNYKYLPNEIMLEKALEMVKDEYKLLVIGKGVEEAVKEGCGKNVVFKNYVTDYYREVGKARVGLFPLKIAMGMQNKALDCLSLSMPLIISPVVKEGLKDFLTKDFLEAYSILERYDKEELDYLYNGIKANYRVASKKAGEAYKKYVEFYKEQKRKVEKEVGRLLD
ncbi:MAG: glycosyltransferase [Bdellovibrio sp.]|nr:MAG: glycosyltransferase [Bdellovibrio sp.]